MFSIFILIGFALFLGMGLSIMITKRPPPGGHASVPPEEEADDPKWKNHPLSMAQVYQFADDLCKKNHLEIKERSEVGPHESYWVAESTNEFFQGNYVLGFCEATETEPYVTMSMILEFKDLVKGKSSSKGFYFTNGFFTRDVLQPLEGRPVTLYNKKRIINDLKNPSPKLD